MRWSVHQRLQTESRHFLHVTHGRMSAKYIYSTLFLDEFARTGLRGKPVRNAVLIACFLARWHSVLLSVILAAAGKLSPVAAGHAPAGHE
jgi:hypothetical protein